MERQKELYCGKAKSLYATDDEQVLIAHFRDDTSAFDGVKKAQLARKGAVNNQFSAAIMTQLAEAGITTHFIELLNDTDSAVKNLEMLPIECVVRNFSAGSLCRRLGVPPRQAMSPPLFEFFLKNDDLHDPLITVEHILAFGWANADEVLELKRLSLAVNEVLQPLFLAADLLLVDFKLEFGRYQGQLVLGDEFTPDGCRVWDRESQESLDKDRFRQDLGQVVESYEIIAQRLGIALR